MLRDFLQRQEKYLFRELLTFWELPKTSNIKRVQDYMQSSHGIRRILSKLQPESFQIIRFLYTEKKDAQFSEILGLFDRLKPPEVEEILNSLCIHGFLYCKKNKIKLNNAFDKYYIYPEISKHLTILRDELTLETLRLHRRQSTQLDDEAISRLPHNEHLICETLFQYGGVLPAYELEDLTGGLLAFPEVMEHLVTEKFVIRLHKTHPTYQEFYLMSDGVFDLFERHMLDKCAAALVPSGLPVLQNLFTVLVFFTKNGSRTTQKNEVPQKTLLRLGNSLPALLRKSPFLQPYKTERAAKHRCDLCRKLGWLQQTDDQLEVTGLGQRISREGARAAVTQLLDYFRDMPSDEAHHEFCTRLLRDLEREPHNIYHTGAVIGRFLRRRYLEALTFSSLIRRYRELHDFSLGFFRDLSLTGLIDAVQNKHGTYFRASRLLKAYRTRAGDQVDPSLIINSNFEIIAFPEKLRLEDEECLLNFCTFQKEDNVLHFKLSKESIYRGSYTHDNSVLLPFLRQASSQPLPQNIEFNIEEWVRSIVELSVEPVYLLETNNDATIELFEHSHEFKDWRPRRLAPKILCVNTFDRKKLASFADKHKIIVDYRSP